MTQQPARAMPDRRGGQVVRVTVDGGYRPGSIIAFAGVPLRMVFERDEDDPCSERVIFSSPRLDRRLPLGTTVIDLPAQGPGEIRFTCAMGRYRGVIRLEAPARPAAPGGRMGRLGAFTGRIFGLLSIRVALALGRPADNAPSGAR